ncbi:hypothetical protein BDW60DRAFT_91310 [Aspergillus nidulans var. acristatus]
MNQFTVYRYQTGSSQYDTRTETDPRVLSQAALHAEEFTINVPPVSCKLSKRAGQSAVFVRSGPIRWYRIISFRGLAAIIDPEYNQLTDHRRFSAMNAFSMIFQLQYLNLMYHDVWELHINCRSRSEAANPFELESDWPAFHITWFRIGPDKKWPEFSNWKSGRLYGTTDKDHLEEVAFTMCFYPSRNSSDVDSLDNLENLGAFERPSRTAAEHIQYLKESGFWYWCVLVLAPAHFDTVWGGSKRQRAINDSGHLAPMRLILEALEDAADSWEAIAEYLTRVVNTRGAIFDPDLHDRLLFDDDAFSRSRLYFWAIDSLEIFIPTIAANIREWENFWNARKFVLGCYSTGSHGEPPRMLNETYESVLQQIEEQVSRLAALKARLEFLREQIKTLRDGLFNASAVIESRAATELGQNVKLLTYVSIVFLPLSFCAALWSIDYSYHTVVFIVLTVLISTTTYLIVMNLNNLTQLGKELYQHPRKSIIRSMRNDSDWDSIGERFSQFRPERQNNTPTEWYIPMFLVLQLWKWITGVWFKLRGKTNKSDV